MINVYVGYDSRQDYPPKFSGIKNPCYEVCKQSILNYSKNVNVLPIKLNDLISKACQTWPCTILSSITANLIAKNIKNKSIISSNSLESLILYPKSNVSLSLFLIIIF